MKALCSDISVFGLCIRRDQVAQRERVLEKLQKVAEMVGHVGVVSDSDVLLNVVYLHTGDAGFVWVSGVVG